MLNIENLHKHYEKKHALKGINLSVSSGEIYALLGPNGAGKTTTLNCCLGFETPSEGHVQINGLNPCVALAKTRQQIAYIPENVALYGELSGIENLEYFSELSGHTYKVSALQAFLEKAGLQKEATDRPLKNYSKGMRQKVGVAIALAKKAKVLLLDEPTSGLDPRASHDFSLLLAELAKDGMAILMATHDLFRTRETATHVGILSEGRLVAEMDTSSSTSSEIEEVYLQKTSVNTAAL